MIKGNTCWEWVSESQSNTAAVFQHQRFVQAAALLKHCTCSHFTPPGVYVFDTPLWNEHCVSPVELSEGQGSWSMHIFSLILLSASSENKKITWFMASDSSCHIFCIHVIIPLTDAGTDHFSAVCAPVPALSNRQFLLAYKCWFLKVLKYLLSRKANQWSNKLWRIIPIENYQNGST